MKIKEVDVAIVGAGSAGLSAAYQAATAGAKVLVMDENRLPGGQLFKQIHKFLVPVPIRPAPAAMSSVSSCWSVSRRAAPRFG